MSCERFNEAITDHACGAPLDEAAAAHFAGCAVCRGAYDDHRRLLESIASELHEALAVTASPEFAGRVSARARVVSPSRVSTPWWIGAAAAAALGAAVYVGIPRGTRTEPVSGSTPAPIVRTESAKAPVAVPPPAMLDARIARHVAKPLTRGMAKRVRPAAASTRTLMEPEVIVPPTQARAIARLKELVQTGVLDDTTLPPPPPEASAEAELVIAPLTIPDIVIPDVQSVGGTAVTGGRESEARSIR